MTIIRVTNDTQHWFAPLLSEELIRKLKQDKTFYLIGAVKEKTACGVLAFSLEKTVNIEYIAVSQGYPWQDVANEMLDFLCSYMAEEAILILCPFAAGDVNEPLYCLFEEREDFFLEQTEGSRKYLTKTQILNNEALGNVKYQAGSVRGFFDYPQREQREFLKKLENQGLFYLSDSVVFDNLIKPLCLTTVKGGEIKAAAFIGRGGKQSEYQLSFIWCAQGSAKDLFVLLVAAKEKLLEEMPEDGKLFVEAVEPEADSILNKLFPEAESSDRYYIAVWDMDYIEEGEYNAYE